MVSDYEALEPDGKDAWNPALLDSQLRYRLSLMYATRQALRASQLPLERMKVVDVGCGNGRSTRMYLDFGLMPEQVQGFDVRPGAIALARKLNPAIRFDTYDGSELPVADGSVDWIAVCTVFSSIQGSEHRRALAQRLTKKLAKGGVLFFFDLTRALDFAGGDLLEPDFLFAGLERLYFEPIYADELVTSPEGEHETSTPDAAEGFFGFRFGRGGRLSWIPRHDGLTRALKQRMPPELRRLVRTPKVTHHAALFRVPRAT